MNEQKHSASEHLELMVGKLHDFLRTDLRYGNRFLPSPFMVELTGSPSAGKTTCITELDKFLRRHDFRVLRPQEGAEVIRHIPRTTPEYNLRTGLYALEMVIDYSYGHAYDIVIFDRGIFDPNGWMMYWEEKSLLSKKECQLFQQFFLSRFWVDRIVKSYILVCDPEEAMRREMRIALSDKLGETTNPDSVTRLVNRYKALYRTLAPQFPQLEIMDTTCMAEQEMVEHIATTTLETLLAKARERHSQERAR